MLISDAFEASFERLQNRRVLQPIVPEHLPKHIVKTFGSLTSINLLVLSCCDGHQFMDITQRTKICCEQLKQQLGVTCLGEDCFHWKTVHGGPYVLSVPDLKVQEYRGEPEYTERHVLRELEEAMNLKKLNVLLFIPHAKCGKMKDRFNSPDQYVDYAARAKEHAMSWFGMENDQIISWLQVHRHDGRQMHHVDYRSARALAA